MKKQQSQKSTYSKRRPVRKHLENVTNYQFPQLIEWLSQIKRPVRNQYYSDDEILLFKNYLEIVEGIQLSKKSFENTLTFRCKNIAQCGFFIEFQRCQNIKVYNKDPRFRLKHFPRSHSTQDHPQCYLEEQQNILNQRKIYLTLIRASIHQLILCQQCPFKQKSPTWVMKKLEQSKNQRKDFFYEGLRGLYRRQLKKAFDNTIGKIKNELKQQFNVVSNSTRQKKYPKTKKISKKIKLMKKKQQQQIQVQQEPNINQIFVENSQKTPVIKYQHHEIKMIDYEILEQKSPNVFQKCFKEAKIEDVFNQNFQKQKIQKNIYLTPTKTKKKYAFDLQKSTQKRQSTYQRSYKQSFLVERFEKQKSIKSDSEISEKPLWTPEKTFQKESKKQLSGDFNLQSKISVSDNESRGIKDQIGLQQKDSALNKKNVERFFL